MTMNLMTESFPLGEIASHLSRQHPALFSTVVEQSSVAISLTDPQARIVYTNPAFCRLTGFSLSQLLGENHRVLASQQTPREVYQEMWHTLLQGEAWRGQLINRRGDGSLYLADIDITPIVNSQGELEHYLAMHKDISTRYALEQRLRNHMTLTTAVLNNIPAAVVVVNENDRAIMDNLAYKTLCADCGGQELLAVLDYHNNKAALREGRPQPVSVRGMTRWLTLGIWALPGVNEEASRYFTDSALPRTLIVITDCTEQQQQQQQGQLDRLKQQITSGTLLAAIRESLDAALVQLNCPLNMLAAARRLNGEDRSNVALESAWREGEEAVARLQACRPSLAFEPAGEWPVKTLLDDLCALYHTRFNALHCVLSSPQLTGFGQRTQVLACLSLWLDRTLALSTEIVPAETLPFSLAVQIYAREEGGWLSLYIEDNVPLMQVRYAAAAAATISTPGKGMELRLIQTLVAHHQGAIDLTSRPAGGTCLTLRFPLSAVLTGGAK